MKMMKNLESGQNKLFHKERINQNAIRLTEREREDFVFAEKLSDVCLHDNENLFANKQATTSKLQHRAFCNIQQLLIAVGEMIFKLELIN